MDFTTFVRKPFVVEAVEVTVENIHELSELIGTFHDFEGDTPPYIRVNSDLVPNVSSVHLGYWVTRMGRGTKNIRCYSAKIFKEQFIEMSPEVEGWVRFAQGESAVEKEAI